eukprot:5566918-Pyramimonas_sp.AAC.1
MAAAGVRSLDVAERQCLIDFFEDENGFHWHHRLLLKPTPVPGRWIICAPDLSCLLYTSDAADDTPCVDL